MKNSLKVTIRNIMNKSYILYLLLTKISAKNSDSEINLDLNPIEVSYLFSLVDTHLFSLDESTREYKIFESIVYVR